MTCEKRSDRVRGDKAVAAGCGGDLGEVSRAEVPGSEAHVQVHGAWSLHIFCCCLLPPLCTAMYLIISGRGNVKLISKCTSQVREQESLRMKGKLGITSAGSGSGKFNQKFMRSITMSPGGATWQVCYSFQSISFAFL